MSREDGIIRPWLAGGLHHQPWATPNSVHQRFSGRHERRPLCYRNPSVCADDM